MGREGYQRRSEAGRYARVNAARHGEAGGGRAREAVEDYPRGRRVLGSTATGGRSTSALGRTGQRAATLPADTDGNWRREKYDSSVSRPGGFLFGAAEVDGQSR